MRRSLALMLLATLPALALAVPTGLYAQEAAGTADHDAMDHASMDHSGHANHGMPDVEVSDQPGDALPPPVPIDHPADRFFPADRMEESRRDMVREMRFTTLALQVDRLEYRAANGADGFGWEGQAWYGGDIDRIVVASEGEGAFGERAERIEVNAFWRRALDPWFNLQLGVRQDFRPDPQRSYAMIGIEGLAPYWFEVNAQLFVSNKGDLHARSMASYQQRITQSLVVEPEVEVDFAFQDVPDLRVASGFEQVELGARVRYDRNRSLAPYVGVHWERRLGGTARLAREAGEEASGVSAVFGVRAMF